MLLELLVLLGGGLLVAVVGLVLFKIVSCRLALIQFVKKSNGLPVYPDLDLLGNHLNITLSPNSCNLLLEGHKTLGPYVGVLLSDWKRCVSTTNLDLIKKIVLDEPDRHLDRLQLNLPLEEYEHSIMTAPKDQWRRARRVVGPALKSNKFKAPNVLREIEDSIGKLIGHIERRLIANNNLEAQFEADNFVHKYSLDLVFSCFFKQYQEINFDEAECRWQYLIDSQLENIQTNFLVKLAMIFPILRGLVDKLVWHFHEQGLSRQRIREYVKMQTKIGIEARKQLQESSSPEMDRTNFLLSDGTRYRRNLIDHVVDQFLDGKLTQTEYFHNSCFMLAAADKTACDCLVHTIYLLSIHQQVQDKLRESIKTHGVESEYLDWVLHESLRLMPPANIGCSRSLSCDIPLEDGRLLPKGTMLITCAYVIHRLKEYWGEDAEEFRPERWQDASRHHPMQFLSFGAGPRGCPGREFALFEMKMLFAALLTRYKFEGQPKEDAYLFSAPLLIFLLPNSPTNVTIRRLDAES